MSRNSDLDQWISWYEVCSPQPGDIVNVGDLTSHMCVYPLTDPRRHLREEGKVYAVSRSNGCHFVSVEFSRTDILMFTGQAPYQANFLFEGLIYSVGLFTSFCWRAALTEHAHESKGVI